MTDTTRAPRITPHFAPRLTLRSTPPVTARMPARITGRNAARIAPRLVWLTLLATLAAAAPAAGQQPAWVSAAERRGEAPPSPAEQPEAWLVAHIDVETTGLVPGWHELIDIGIVLTDLGGAVRDSFFIRVLPDHPERLSPGAQAVNAFDAARWHATGAVTPAAAVERIEAFHARAAGGRAVIMAAYNSQFDTAFLDHLFRSQGRSWRELYHYFVLDIPSMAWALGVRDLANGVVAARLGVEDEPRVAEEHTGLTGALLNVRIYRALLARAPGALGLFFPGSGAGERSHDGGSDR